MVGRQPSKLIYTGSNPVPRSNAFPRAATSPGGAGFAPSIFSILQLKIPATYADISYVFQKTRPYRANAARGGIQG